jgi:hypothetical protein
MYTYIHAYIHIQLPERPKREKDIITMEESEIPEWKRVCTHTRTYVYTNFWPLHYYQNGSTTLLLENRQKRFLVNRQKPLRKSP